MKLRPFRVALWTGLIVGVAVLAAVLWSAARVGVTRPTLYELSNGYRGWFRISYEDPACPPPSTRGLYQVIRIDNDGRGCTSGALPRGWHYQTAEYASAGGARASAPAVWPLGHSAAEKVMIAFIGTEHEFRSSPQPPWLWARERAR
jgi:hypothetical protein